MIYTIDSGWIDGELISAGNYYIEVRRPMLFSKGSVALYEYAHPNSMSMNHLLATGEYSELEEFKQRLNQLADPIETAWGNV